MEICVVTPSPDTPGHTAARGRWLPLAEPLRGQGHRLSFEAIDQLRSAAQLTYGVLLFSGDHDARCDVVCHLLKDSEKLVGVDLVDDTFSPQHDSRLIRHRDWLRAMTTRADFAVCNTPQLRDLAAAYLPGLPGHVLGGVIDLPDAQAVTLALRAQLERTLRTRQIDIGCIDVGDPAHVPPGLHGFHAFGDALGALARDGWRVTLRILAERRSMTADALERLARMPLPWSLDEWSAEGEAELLRGSLVVFIPVDARPHSMARPLHRAAMSLAAGAQLLSVGHPLLHDNLGPFAYRQPAALLKDLASGQLRSREATVPALLDLLTAGHGALPAAEAFSAFLGLVAQRRPSRGPERAKSAKGANTALGMVHGVRSDKRVHQLAQRAGQLSIGSPYSNPGLNYDLRFTTDGGSLQVQFSDAAAALLRAEFQRALRPAVSASGRPVKALHAGALLPASPSALILEGLSQRTRAEQLAGYAAVMGAVTALVQALLGPVSTRLSEQEAPYSASGPQ